MSSGRSGQGRLGCFLAIVVIGCFVAGGQSVITAVKNRVPLEMSCADYVAKKPAGEWLRLKDCALDLVDATYFKDKKSGRIKKVFIPVRPAEANSTAPIHLLLQTEDPSAIGIVDKIGEVGNDEVKLLDYVVKNRDKVYPTRSVEGLIAWGMDVESDQLRDIKRLNQSLTPDFKIIMEGSTPSLAWGLLLLAGGCVAGLILFKVARG